MNAAEIIISKFGTQQKFAEALSVRQSNVSYWAKVGTIPARWYAKIIERGAALGIQISANDFLDAAEPAGVEIAQPLVKPTKDLKVLKLGILDIAGEKVPCAVLSNGKRIFFQREI